MESSNQETEEETNSRQWTIEEETIRKTTAETKIRKLIRIQKGRTAKKIVKLHKHKEIHEKKRCHYLGNTIPLSYSYTFLQLLDLQEKEDKNSNKASRENIACGT